MKLSTDPNPSAVEVRVPLIALWRFGGVTPQASESQAISHWTCLFSGTAYEQIDIWKKFGVGLVPLFLSLSNPSLFDIAIGKCDICAKQLNKPAGYRCLAMWNHDVGLWHVMAIVHNDGQKFLFLCTDSMLFSIMFHGCFRVLEIARVFHHGDEWLLSHLRWSLRLRHCSCCGWIFRSGCTNFAADAALRGRFVGRFPVANRPDISHTSDACCIYRDIDIDWFGYRYRYRYRNSWILISAGPLHQLRGLL